MSYLLILVSFLIILIINLYVTFHVVNHDGYTDKQKLIQLVCIFFFPLIGSYVIYKFMVEDKKPAERDSTNYSPQIYNGG